jgi:hypothetical protein
MRSVAYIPGDLEDGGRMVSVPIRKYRLHIAQYIGPIRGGRAK